MTACCPEISTTQTDVGMPDPRQTMIKMYLWGRPHCCRHVPGYANGPNQLGYVVVYNETPNDILFSEQSGSRQRRSRIGTERSNRRCVWSPRGQASFRVPDGHLARVHALADPYGLDGGELGPVLPGLSCFLMDMTSVDDDDANKKISGTKSLPGVLRPGAENPLSKTNCSSSTAVLWAVTLMTALSTVMLGYCMVKFWGLMNRDDRKISTDAQDVALDQQDAFVERRESRNVQKGANSNKFDKTDGGRDDNNTSDKTTIDRNRLSGDEAWKFWHMLFSEWHPLPS